MRNSGFTFRAAGRSVLSSPAGPEYQGESDDQHHSEHPHPSGIPSFHAISVHGTVSLYFSLLSLRLFGSAIMAMWSVIICIIICM